MSKLAAHVQHFKRGSVGSLANHSWYKRSEKDVHSNQDIDPQRSKENVSLVLPEKNLYQDVKALVDGATGRVTSNSIWVSEWIIYPPEDLQDPLKADKIEVQRYYQDVLDWMQQKGYVVPMAVIHMDETTVHAHIDTVPLTKDGRLSRKDVYTRANLNMFHTGLAEYLASRGWDIQRGESTQGKQIRAQTVPEYKKQAEAEKIAALEQIQEAKADLQEAQEQAAIELDVAQTAREMSGETLLEVQDLEERRDALQGELTTLEAQIQGRKDDLQILERALKERISDAIDRGFTGTEIKERVAAMRNGDRREQHQSLVDAFLQLSSVQPLWEAFLRENARGSKAKTNDNPVR